jgi:hypothetical protein
MGPICNPRLELYNYGSACSAHVEWLMYFDYHMTFGLFWILIDLFPVTTARNINDK